MFKSETINDFFFLPRLDLGWIWRWLNVAPARPNSEETEATLVAWIRDPGENMPVGIVHRIPDERLFFTPIKEGSGHLDLSASRHLTAPSSELITGQTIRPPSLLGPEGDLADNDVKRLLIKSYYGKKAPGILAALTLA